MAWKYNKAVLLLAGACALSACAQSERTLLTAKIVLTPPESALQSLEGNPLWNEAGYFDLQSFPAFVQLTVGGEDMDPVQAVWPESAADLGNANGRQEVSANISVDVDAGSNRTVEVVAFLYDGKPSAFALPQPELVDLEAGADVDLDVTLQPLGFGTVTGSAAAHLAEVWLVDVETKVRLQRTATAGSQYHFASAPFARSLAVVGVSGEDEALTEPVPLPHLLGPGTTQASVHLE